MAFSAFSALDLIQVVQLLFLVLTGTALNVNLLLRSLQLFLLHKQLDVHLAFLPTDLEG
jgi:hypothetical protein